MTAQTWLVAHDLTDLGDAAAREAARLAQRTGDRLFLLHVSPPEDREPYERNGKITFAQEEEIRRALLKFAGELKEVYANLAVDVEALVGSPVERVLEEAERVSAHLIVVGTHDRKGLARLLLGSVAEEIVHKARLPVLVVKGAEG